MAMSEHIDGLRDANGDAKAPTVEQLRRLIEADAETLRREHQTGSNVKFIDVPELLPAPKGSGFPGPRDPEDNYGPEELRRIIDGRGKEEPPPISREPVTMGGQPFVRFPTRALPEPVRGYVELGAQAIGCDTSCLALPMLAGLASAIGSTRRLRLKRGWSVPAVIWTAIVGESGTVKSAAFEVGLEPFQHRQRQALERHAAALEQYQSDRAQYEEACADWERVLRNERPLEKPVRPQLERTLVIDATVEALGPLLAANPRGLLLARDELAGWVGAFDRYAEGKGGAEAGHWLAMHNAASLVVDRKSRAAGTSICVGQAAVSVTGCLQPAGLRRAVTSGLAARLLVSWPPFAPQEWSDVEMDPEAEAEVGRLIDRLYELEVEPAADDDEPQPVVIELTPDAKLAWKRYYNAHARDRTQLPRELSAAFSKLAEYAARLALVVHYVRWAAEDPQLDDAERIDSASIGAAVELAEWFKSETRRVYALLGLASRDTPGGKLMEWILHKGGSVTVRDVQRALQRYPTAADAEAALEALVEAGEGRWAFENGGRRGPTARQFRAFFTDRF